MLPNFSGRRTSEKHRAIVQVPSLPMYEIGRICGFWVKIDVFVWASDSPKVCSQSFNHCSPDPLIWVPWRRQRRWSI
jgi:hypothetical protein